MRSSDWSSDVCSSDLSVPVYTSGAADSIDYPLVAQYQVDPAQEQSIRKQFRKADRLPKILIFTDNLLTGFDAPVLNAMSLPKPMRDHVLLQELPLLHRPTEHSEDRHKPQGMTLPSIGIPPAPHQAL